MKNSQRTSQLGLFAAAFIGLALLVGCQPANDESKSSSGSTKKQVTILGVMVGEQQRKLEQALAPFKEQTGIEIVYEGTHTFTTTLPIRVDSGNPPDLAMFPQPGLMADFAREGKLIPLKSFMTPEQLQSAYADSWLELGSVDDTLYGVWYRA